MDAKFKVGDAVEIPYQTCGTFHTGVVEKVHSYRVEDGWIYAVLVTRENGRLERWSKVYEDQMRKGKA